MALYSRPGHIKRNEWCCAYVTYISGSRVPAAIAATNAMMLSVQLVRSAYLKMRWYNVILGLSLILLSMLTT